MFSLVLFCSLLPSSKLAPHRLDFSLVCNVWFLIFLFSSSRIDVDDKKYLSVVIFFVLSLHERLVMFSLTAVNKDFDEMDEDSFPRLLLYSSANLTI
jgi:hypothetical protein